MASIFERLRDWFFRPLLDADFRERLVISERARNYRTGIHARPLKVKPGQQDDNTAVNYTGLVVKRSVALLFGKGIEFDAEDDESPEMQYLEAVWNANKQEILLMTLATFGAEQGTCYLKIMPDATQLNGVVYPRLVAVDPALVTIQTRPDDKDIVLRYIIEYVVPGLDGKDEARRQVTERDDGIEFTQDGQQIQARQPVWYVRDYVSSAATNGRWVVTSEIVWPFEFPPIHHWQNLPEPTSVYGSPDVTPDVIELQDRVNYVASNIAKIVRLYAHPQRYGKNLGQLPAIALGPDQMPNYNTPDAEIRQLDALGDLASSQAFLQFLRASLFDVTMTVDMSSFADKIGAVTNFGLRVLFEDALSKNGQKQELYGDALIEINRRLLVLAGYDGADPIKIIWPDPLPVDDQAQILAIRQQLELQLMSKTTAQLELGLDPEIESERMGEEQSTSESVGSMILRAFEGGQ